MASCDHPEVLLEMIQSAEAASRPIDRENMTVLDQLVERTRLDPPPMTYTPETSAKQNPVQGKVPEDPVQWRWGSQMDHFVHNNYPSEVYRYQFAILRVLWWRWAVRLSGGVLAWGR
jgi:hypothetical protein